MRILVLSFYYQPDLCAGSFRNTAVVEQLKKIAPSGSHIDVITTMPNRYASFSSEALERESEEGVEIRRIELPLHKSGMMDQSRAFLKYAKETIDHCKDRDYDLVYASSSRLMTAVLGAYISRKKKVPLYLDIRDIFVDTLSELLPGGLSIIFVPFFSLIERLSFRMASRINLVSEGFRSYFESRYPAKELSFFTNGIDAEFVNQVCNTPKTDESRSVIKILYAGNIGAGQGLHKVIPPIALRLGSRVHFRVIGDGGQLSMLKESIGALGLSNVELIPPMPRERLIEEYVASDVLFLHLNNYKAFEKVLPSKLFEYAAMNKPIWAGLAGYSARFIEAEIINHVLFRPADIDDAVASFEHLTFTDVTRTQFVKTYSRQNIASEMAKSVLATLKIPR